MHYIHSVRVDIVYTWLAKHASTSFNQSKNSIKIRSRNNSLQLSRGFFFNALFCLWYLVNIFSFFASTSPLSLTSNVFDKLKSTLRHFQRLNPDDASQLTKQGSFLGCENCQFSHSILSEFTIFRASYVLITKK